MKFTYLIALALTVACGRSAHADATQSFSNVPTLGGLRGLHLDRPATDPLPHGLAFDYNGLPAWGMGLDATLDYPGIPDLVLAYSQTTDSDQLRIRADDGRVSMGPRVGHPVIPAQLSIEAGTPAAPLLGLAIGTYDYQYSIYLYNRGTSLRTSLNFHNIFAWITDERNIGDGDIALYNYQTRSQTLCVTEDNSLKVSTPKLGFYSATPVTRPILVGNIANGSALESVVAALTRLGLVEDRTTP